MKIKNVKIFSIQSNLSSFPSYAICAAHRLNDKEIRGESFLLTVYKTKKAKVIAMEVFYDSVVSNKNFAVIDELFVIEECLNQAKLNMLDSGKNKIGHYDFSILPFIQNVCEVKIEYLFHGIFAPEAIQSKIQDIGRLSQIDDLKKLVEMVSKHKHCLFTSMKADTD